MCGKRVRYCGNDYVKKLREEATKRRLEGAPPLALKPFDDEKAIQPKYPDPDSAPRNQT